MSSRILRRLWLPNRKYKDRLFRRVFRNKKDLLELYNAINKTNYTNENDLKITTLENVIFMSMKNDVSFIVSSTMNLYEHQSTINYNMPLRGLLYFARLYDTFIKTNNLDIYGKKMVKLPMPQYVVFYNGRDDLPDQSIMKLSDAFESGSSTLTPAVECIARIINVNHGHNNELLNSCKRLLHYSIFVEKVNQNISDGYSLQEAINKAIDECLAEGVLEDILNQNRAEVCHMLLTEFNQKKHDKNMWQEGYSEGRESGYSEGHESGYSEGRESGYSEGREGLIVMMIKRGKTPEEIADLIGEDVEVINNILKNQK